MSNLSKENLIVTIEELCCNIYKLRSNLKEIYDIIDRQPPNVLLQVQEICKIAINESMILPDSTFIVELPRIPR